MNSVIKCVKIDKDKINFLLKNHSDLFICVFLTFAFEIGFCCSVKMDSIQDDETCIETKKSGNCCRAKRKTGRYEAETGD